MSTLINQAAVKDTGPPLFPSRTMTIVAGMSGGVDSSVAALLLQRQGHAVTGLFMKNWEDEQAFGQCTAAQDLADAMAVCDLLGIAIDGENFSAEYQQHVFQHFLSALRRGLTPNPDILCNREIKFRVFLEHALRLGADAIATGHYARIDRNHGRLRLLKAVDRDKDQSYFLYTLGQRELARSIFPLGELTKTEVRRIAMQAGFPNHRKKDSTGICFIGERHFRTFLRNYFTPQPGTIQTPEGRTLGMHEGLMFYTLGQRRGLGIGGQAGTRGEPWYVAAKDSHSNMLVVVQGHQHPLLHSTALIADDMHWVNQPPVEEPFRCQAKIRYRQSDQSCSISRIDSTQFKLTFDHQQWAVTPGQSVVLYDGEACLGGGIIRQALR